MPASTREPNQPDMLLTQKDVAELLSISIRQVRRMTSAGQLPKPVLLSHSPRWKASAIQDYIDHLPEAG